MFERPDQDKRDSLGLPHVSRPISFVAAAAWTIGVVLLLVLALTITESARPGASLDVVNLTACIVLTYSVTLFAMLRVYAPTASVREVLGVRASSPLATLLAAASGVALCPALGVVEDFLTKRFPLPTEESDLVQNLLQTNSLVGQIVFVLAFAVVVPVSEELFFRGALFGGLRRGRAEGIAVLATAVFFAASELSPREVLTAFVLGLFASWLRGRSGSIVPSVLAVMAYNAAKVLPSVIARRDVSFGPRMAVGGVVVAAVLSWAAGAIFARDPRAETGRLLDA
jgi:membrane protease YdiL (CAAX protease family)